MAGVLFEDIFDVKDIDPEGKKFDRGKYISHCMPGYYCVIKSESNAHLPVLSNMATSLHDPA